MNQVQKTSGEWHILEARTNGFFDGEQMAVDCSGKLSEGYKKAFIME